MERVRAPTVLLFDIDGTLVTTGGAGRRAMERAFEQTTGRRDATRFPFAGMTDRAIVRMGLRMVGHEDDDQAVDRLLAIYISLLGAEVDAASDYDVYPGIVRALDAAERTADTAVGLGTGNVREGARIKLSRGKLHQRFAFGGFGCDHEERAELLRAGAERGAAWLRRPRSECRVVVIGDTVRDVDAGLAIGAEVLAVGTGGEELEVLRARGASLAVRDLDEPGALDALLG
ncbi:MAG: haloacid dehalogenase-like hydrolase [Polyangiaceae bacterium]|nr:haloacid dehalogenase-like hydrolase [Polyangiaceae bacterium]MCE7888247.1 HAD family hydrolase [Sorangiineae bacterium PRO1]MCL4749081.1 haloacid dehalogenase-like hydrolase [Myxococcales bacterium]